MRLLSAVILAILGAIGFADAAKADSIWAAEIDRAFNARDIESGSLAPFAKWQAALARARAEDERSTALCSAAPASIGCEQRGLHVAFLESLRGLAPLEQVKSIHAYVNRVLWIDDKVNYGVSDYWATPDEFYTRGGDCEDFAFAKFEALKRLGFGNDQMRILILDDLKLRQPHAVLLVLVDQRLWVLDNELRGAVPADSIRHYDPIYSINERGWWMHSDNAQDVNSAGRRH
jgi:predicted transglutaminase-like cysteine proteinase